MSENKFAHLHVHSEYSLLDGSAKIKELVSRAKELGMDSIAITDHGVMFGVIDFYKAAKDVGVKPIIGCEVYVASNSRRDKTSGRDNFYYHLVLLAENNEGYNNLIKLVSYGFTEGFYYKPRVDIELIKKYSKGLIALSACLAGPVTRNLLNVSYARALQEAIVYDEIFGRGNFYLELQNHGMIEQQKANAGLIQISEETGIPLVCTNDVHYIYEQDAKAHEILLCIQTGKTIEDEDRMVYEGDQFFLKSPEEMNKLFAYRKDAMENTISISSRCEVTIEFNNYKLPKYYLPPDKNSFEFLREISLSGLNFHYKEITDELLSRLNYELAMINEMGFGDYFLVVWDFIKFAKDNNIIVGPGRGSAAGSLVAYCLGITNIDPLKYNLIFERFLNPERISMPDIDIDFCYERRQEVIDYVIGKYGNDHVAQIITFGTMAARGAIRDVGRALAYAYSDVDRIAKMIPFAIGITIKKALEMNPELSSAYKDEEDTKYLIDMAMRLEGLPRHASTHAAGVLICDDVVIDHVPLYQNDGVITTQFPMNTLEELGLLKMDFLGLRTLTVIQNALKEIERNHKIKIDIDKLDFEDQKIYTLISQGYTEGVFQLESSGMKQFMKELQPANIEDIIAGISLYRPGPMDFIPKYVKGKRNPEKIEYTHESLKNILEPTYGCIVYQEQVMQIVRDLAGYSLGRSDLLRRAMSKKKSSVMKEEQKNFIYGLGDDTPGCIKNGIPKAVAEKIFEEMSDFAKYAFNKSHAAAYAVIGYQTAWLKVHYPIEFMAALMTSVMDFPAKVSEYINVCKRMGIELLPPDVNEGFAHFSVSKGKIRFGLLAIKNVGKNAVLSLVKERKKKGIYKSFTEFINRLESSDVNKRFIESMIKAGAFDSFGGTRIQYMTIYKRILSGISQSKKYTMEGQLNLFQMIDDGETEIYKDEPVDDEEYTEKEKLEMEKEVLGIYVSGHPLSEYEEVLNKYVTAKSLDFVNQEQADLGESIKITEGETVCVGGMIEHISVKYTKNNKAMAFITLEDLCGTIEVIVFPNVYEKYMGRLSENTVIVVNGKATVKEEEDGKVLCNSIKFFDELLDEEQGTAKVLWIKIPNDLQVEISNLTYLLSQFKGRTPVMIYDEKNKKKFRADEKFWIKENSELIEGLKRLLGNNCVIMK